MKLSIIFVIMGSVCHFSSSQNPRQPGSEFYHSLPEDEKQDFLIFSLGHGYTANATKLHRMPVPDFRFPDALGIEDDRIEKFQNLQYPENFISNLYTWIRARYNLDEAKIRRFILERSVCLANGKCIDINDIGGLCCPF